MNTLVSIPDARQDFAGAINFLLGELVGMRRDITALKTTVGTRESLTLKDLAIRYDCSVSTLARSPWRLPNYGVPDFGENPKRWWVESVEEWEKPVVPTRKEAWESLSPKERRKIMGIEA